MTRRRELEQRRHSLGEIREIMNSMKTLAYLETRRLERFLAAQQAVVADVERAAADFLAFHPDTLPRAGDTTLVYLLVGSERGLCGDFNHVLLRVLEEELRNGGPNRPLLLPVGRKLHALLEQDARVTARVAGASVVDEVAGTLQELIRALAEQQLQHGPLTLRGLYHGPGGETVRCELLPPLQHLLGQQQQFPDPPLLNLPPRAFLLELADHYLFAALHQLLYASLMAENQQRVSHLEAAVRHLDNQAAELARQGNVLRQEEIIEEIEVILLSAVDLQEIGRGRLRSGQGGR